jgi:hypothetical protein
MMVAVLAEEEEVVVEVEVEVEEMMISMEKKTKSSDDMLRATHLPAGTGMWRTIRPMRVERSVAGGEGGVGVGEGGVGGGEVGDGAGASRGETSATDDEREEEDGDGAGDAGEEAMNGPETMPLPVDAPSDILTSESLSCKGI